MLSDKAHVQFIGDTTVVYWAEDAEPMCQDVFSFALFGGAPESETITDEDLRGAVKALSSGLPVDVNGIPLHPQNRFYVLGLSPNAARLSVRFFLQDSFGRMLAHAQAHHDRLAIVRPSYIADGALPLWKLLNETVNPNSRDKKASPPMAGAVQLGFARSVDPIVPQEVTITRVAITTEADAEKKGTEMGRKYIVPYALYRAEGYVSANLARKVTGFGESDLALLWEAILNMFEHDRSAARGKMAVRELIVFKHDSELGCAPAWKLFDTVTIARKDGVSSPRSYADYAVAVNEAALPEGVACTRMG